MTVFGVHRTNSRAADSSQTSSNRRVPCPLVGQQYSRKTARPVAGSYDRTHSVSRTLPCRHLPVTGSGPGLPITVGRDVQSGPVSVMRTGGPIPRGSSLTTLLVCGRASRLAIVRRVVSRDGERDRSFALFGPPSRAKIGYAVRACRTACRQPPSNLRWRTPVNTSSLPARTVTRRRLLQFGGIGALAMGVPGSVAARVDPAKTAGGAEKSCIFILLCGGPSHLDMWDLKPDAPAEIRGPYRPAATTVPGV